MSTGLTIGQYHVPYPLIQGGMGVRVSGHRLAGHVALNGGIGIIATAGLALGSDHYDGRNYFSADRQALMDEIHKAYEIAPDGVIGVNCMVAVKNFEDAVRASCEAGVKIIISGAGLPMNLPGLTADYPDVALVPIVSSLKAAELIARKWHKTYNRFPDAVVKNTDKCRHDISFHRFLLARQNLKYDARGWVHVCFCGYGTNVFRHNFAYIKQV